MLIQKKLSRSHLQEMTSTVYQFSLSTNGFAALGCHVAAPHLSNCNSIVHNVEFVTHPIL